MTVRYKRSIKISFNGGTCTCPLTPPEDWDIFPDITIMGVKFKTTINIDKSYTLTAYQSQSNEKSIPQRTGHFGLSKVLRLEIKKSRDEWLLSLFKLQEYYSAVENEAAGGQGYDLFILEKVYLENETASYNTRIGSHKSYIAALYELTETGNSLSSGDQGGFIWTYGTNDSPEFTLYSESWVRNRDCYLVKRFSRRFYIAPKNSYTIESDDLPKRDSGNDRYISGNPTILRDGSNGQFGSYPSFEGDDDED